MAKRGRRRRERDEAADRPESGAAPTVEAADSAPEVPKWLPGAIFAALTVWLFREFVFSNQMIYGGDTLGLGYVARAFYADALTQWGSIPAWSPLVLGGTPFIEALASGDSLYPPSALLLLLLEPHRALGWKLVVHYLAAGFLMFGWLRSLGSSRAASLLGGTAYMVAPYFVSLVMPGHDGKIFVTALAPLLFWMVERHFKASGFRTVAGIALVVGGVMLTTHFQMAYFLFGAVGLYAMFRSVELAREGAGEAQPEGERRPATRRATRTFATFLLASVLGAGVAAVQFVPAVDYVREHSRRIQTTREAAGEAGVAWSSSWSLHPEDVVALVLPEFSGNNARGADWTQGTYWGRNFTKDNHESAGLVILLLAAVSFVGGARRRLRYFFAGLALLVLLFGLGAHTPVWGFFYAVVPGIRQFRAPGQAMFLFVFAASTLGAIGLDRILRLGRDPDDEGWSPLLKTLGGLTGGLALLAFLAGSGALTRFWTSTIHAPPRPEALVALQPFIARGAGISFLLAVLTLGLVWAFRTRRMPAAVLVGAFVTLVAADELRISTGFIQVFDFYEWSQPDGFVRAVLDREQGSDEPYRMLSFRQRGQDVMPALQGIELVAGHHPNDLFRYRELIGMAGSDIPRNLERDRRIRRLLNVRYVLWPDYQAGGPLGPPEAVLARSQLQDGTPYESVYAEPDLPRARLLANVVVKSDEESVPYMLSPAFDPDTEVVLAEDPPIELDGLPPDGTVTWVERRPDRLELRVATERPTLLVVADNWFPAWRARVGDDEAPVLRAYHTLRAVPVPAGEHDVVLEYRSGVVSLSWMLSLLVTAVLAGGLVLQWVRARRQETEP